MHLNDFIIFNEGPHKLSERNLQLLYSITTILIIYYWIKMKLSSEHSFAVFSFHPLFWHTRVHMVGGYGCFAFTVS